LTKGQQAMALAMIYPDAEKRGRSNKSKARNLAETAKFSRRRLNEARSDGEEWEWGKSSCVGMRSQ
jgi:hypothetical protein